MNFYKKITITIFSILVVFGVSAGLSSAFVGPDPGQTPGTGGGLFNVGSDRTIKYGTGETTPSTGPSSWGHVFTVASTSIPGLGLENLSANGGYFWFADENNRLGLWDEFNSRFNLYVNSSGNIGIGNGNDTATSTLTIFDTGKTNELYVAGGTKATSFTGSGINLTNIDPQNFIAGSAFNSGNYAVNGSFAIGTSTVTAAPSNGLYIGGNIDAYNDINLATDGARIDANALTSDAQIIYGGGGSYKTLYDANSPRVRIEVDDNDSGYGEIELRQGSGDTLFAQIGDGNNSNPTFFTSDLGIGTTNPASILDISGDGTLYRNTSDSGFSSNAEVVQLLDVEESALNLVSNVDSNGATIGSIWFTRSQGQSDHHRNVAGLEAIQEGTGTLAQADLTFITKPSGVPAERMRIDSNGNVGIGTTTPPSKLTVNGTIETLSGGVKFPDGTIQTTAGGGGGGDAVGWDRDDNNGYVYLATSTDQVGIGDSTPSAKLDVNGGIYGSILYDKDNDSYYMNPSGTSNVSQVDVNSTLNVLGNSYYEGSSNTNLYIRQATTSSNGLIWWEDGQNDSNWYIGSTETNSTWKLGRYNSTGSFVDTPFYVDFGNGQVNLNNTIDANSNKIINLAAPTANSDAANKSYVDSTVSGGTASNSDACSGDSVCEFNALSDGASRSSTFLSGDADLTMNGWMYTDGILHEGETGSGPAGLVFGSGNTIGNDQISLLTGGATRMYIDASGNVGISDSSPSVKLDVNGSIYGSTIYDKDNTSYYLNPSGGTSAALAGDAGVGTASIDGARYGTGGKTVEVYEGSDAEIAQLLVQGGSQGTGYIYVGQSSSHGGGITYNGDDTPAMPQATDYISIFRRTSGTDTAVLEWLHNSSRAEFRGVIDGNGNNVYGATFYDSNNTTYYSNPSGTSNLNGLTVNGNWTLSGAAQADVNMNNNDLVGVNKITVGTIDPLYKINGQKYATYVPDTIGLKTEIYGKADLQKEFTGKEYPKFSHTIDFDQVEEGSDLWLFWKTISLADDMSDMIVSLTPEGSNADIWYELDSNENQLTIRADKLATVSYHLVAPRHDSDEWPTKTDAEEEPSFIFEKGKWIK